MLNRRALLYGSIVTALAVPLAVDAQQAGRLPRVGLLANVRSPAIEAFLGGLRQLGYVEDQNIRVEWRLAEGRFDRLPELAAELVGLNVDVILAPGPPYVTAARKATTTIPIVFALVPDPVAMGLVASLARPGGNLTGLTNSEVEMQGKRIDLVAPDAAAGQRAATLSRVGVLARAAPTGIDASLFEPPPFRGKMVVTGGVVEAVLPICVVSLDFGVVRIDSLVADGADIPAPACECAPRSQWRLSRQRAKVELCADPAEDARLVHGTPLPRRRLTPH